MLEDGSPVVPPLTPRAVRRSGRGARRLRRVQPAAPAEPSGPTTWSDPAPSRRAQVGGAGRSTATAAATRAGTCAARSAARRSRLSTGDARSTPAQLPARRRHAPTTSGPVGASAVRRRAAPAGPPLAGGRGLPPRRPGLRRTGSTLLTDDIHYVMPVRGDHRAAAPATTRPRTWRTSTRTSTRCQRRVARFLTEHAWTEDPPSRLRHHVTNVRTFATDDPDELVVESAVLLFRSRGDVREAVAGLGRPRGPAAPRRRTAWQLARRHDPRRRVGAAHAEPGDLPVKPRRWEGEAEDAAAAARAAASSTCPARQRRRRADRHRQRVRRDPGRAGCETRNGARLLIESPKSGQWVALCPLELEALTWQNAATFSAMIGQPVRPADRPEDAA